MADPNDGVALFSLVPVNDRAKEVLAHADNKHLVSVRKGQSGIDIGFPILGKSSNTLATLGRGFDADIYVEDSSIAKIQCSFEVDLNTGLVMFCDKSRSATSQVFGTNATPFEHGRTRRAVVQQGLNTQIGMGGEHCNLVVFELVWQDAAENSMMRTEHFRAAQTEEGPPRWPSHPEARLGTSAQRIRYVVMRKLGSGGFGQVCKVVDLDSRQVMAVKILQRPQELSMTRWRERVASSLQREVKILSLLNHPHIVKYIASQDSVNSRLEIFMGLKEGTLRSLIETGIDVRATAETVLNHMLQALDYIAGMDIIHRDVKPENILYVTTSNDWYHFQLGDFGISNRVPEAVTYSGSPIFMAPEVYKHQPQSCKVDIWSLMVTILFTLDIRGFRQRQFRSRNDIYRTILDAASDESVQSVQEMAIVDPLQRASAAQMLVKLFNSEGLSTTQE